MMMLPKLCALTDAPPRTWPRMALWMPAAWRSRRPKCDVWFSGLSSLRCCLASFDSHPCSADGRIEHIIDRTFVGLEQAQAAHEYMETNANLGKIALTVSSA